MNTSNELKIKKNNKVVFGLMLILSSYFLFTGVGNQQWWKVTTHIDSNTVLKYTFRFFHTLLVQ